jgi:hypothetical protein
MRLTRVRFTVRRMIAGVMVVAAVVAGLVHLGREGGDPLVGVVTVAACVGWLTAVAVSQRDDPRRPVTGVSGSGPERRPLLRPLALAAVLIGVPDVAFVAAYWCLCGGRWYTIYELHGPRDLDVGGVQLAAAVALVVATLLRRALWPGTVRRSTRLLSLCVAVAIVALLLVLSWLFPHLALRHPTGWDEIPHASGGFGP